MQGADCEVINSAFQTPLEVAFDSVIRKEALQSDCEKHIQIIIMIMKEMDSDRYNKVVQYVLCSTYMYLGINVLLTFCVILYI